MKRSDAKGKAWPDPSGQPGKEVPGSFRDGEG